MIGAAPPVSEQKNYITAEAGLKNWLLTRDHKRIALQYLIVVTLFFFLGGLFAVLIRLQLATPKGELFDSNTHNKLFTMHGIIMVFFFLIPSIPAILGNFMIPLMIGAKDLAFPRINLTGLFLASIGLDVHLTHTYFVIAHFHYIMVGGAIMGYSAASITGGPRCSGECTRRAGPSLRQSSCLPDLI